MYATDLLVREVSVRRQSLEDSVIQGRGWRKRGKERKAQKEAIFRQACREVFNTFSIPEEDRASLKKEIASIMGRLGSQARQRNSSQRKKEKEDVAIVSPTEAVPPQAMFTRKQIKRMVGQSLSNINRRKDYLRTDP